MLGSLVGIGYLWLVAVLLIRYWHLSVRDHHRRLDGLDLRIHVNGIRGKSTVTRLIAAVLREGGYLTVAKTTGSAARVIDTLGRETPIRRYGAPTINEQIEIIREHVTPEVDALVIECMAVRPLYQQYTQDHIVRSDITVITNVREDHQEEMGETLEEIADALGRTIPEEGVLITAEGREHLRARLAARARRRGTTTLYADPAKVTDADMRGFDYLQFRENVAIGLAIASLTGVSREDALRGMWKAVPDVGVVRLREYDIRGKRVLWVPMFAANDRESVVLTLANLVPQFPAGAPVIGLLNNRRDRGRRAELFADMVAADLADSLDHVVLLGAYEDAVEARILAGGFPQERVHKWGESQPPELGGLLDQIAALIPGDRGVLLGMVNIHTDQAEALAHHFAAQAGTTHTDEFAASREPARMPSGRQRLRRQATHRTPSADPTDPTNPAAPSAPAS